LRPGDEPAIFLSAGIGATADRLNQFMGKPWYEAAREVTRTLAKRLYGTHQETSLAKGIQAKFRLFAEEFSQYLVREGILEKVVRSKYGNIGSSGSSQNTKKISSDFRMKARSPNPFNRSLRNEYRSREAYVRRDVSKIQDNCFGLNGGGPLMFGIFALGVGIGPALSGASFDLFHALYADLPGL